MFTLFFDMDVITLFNSLIDIKKFKNQLCINEIFTEEKISEFFTK